MVRRFDRMLSTTKAGSSISRVKVDGFFTSSNGGASERPGEHPDGCFVARGRTGVGGKRKAEVVITMSEMSACRSAGGVKSWLDLEWRREDVSNGGGGIGVVRTGVDVVVGGGGGAVVVVVGVVGRERELALLITSLLYWLMTVRFLFLVYVDGGGGGG
jgi:hypothetical protein